MKKLLILSVVVVLLAVSTLPALAKRAVTTEDGCGVPPTQVNKKYALAGWIRAIDLNDKTVTVEVAVGNVLAKPCIGDKVVLSINLEEEETILKVQGGKIIEFAVLGEKYEEIINPPVSSTGYLRCDKYVENVCVSPVWSALQITYGADLVNK